MNAPERAAFDKLFGAAANALPYLERCFEKARVGSPDYFAIPKVIQSIHAALDAAKEFRNVAETQKGEAPPTPVDNFPI